MNLDGVLIRTAGVVGSHLLDGGGHKLGSIRELFFERESGQARFVILELSSLLGGGGKFHPVPWSALRYRDRADGYMTPLTKDDLKGSPAYDREQLADGAYSWGEQTERYFAGLSA